MLFYNFGKTLLKYPLEILCVFLSCTLTFEIQKGPGGWGGGRDIIYISFSSLAPNVYLKMLPNADLGNDSSFFKAIHIKRTAL